VLSMSFFEEVVARRYKYLQTEIQLRVKSVCKTDLYEELYVFLNTFSPEMCVRDIDFASF